MKLSIIVADKSVYINGQFVSNPDLSDAPSNIHALQWNDAQGWIEFVDDASGNKPANEVIDALPQWAADASVAHLVTESFAPAMSKAKNELQNLLHAAEQGVVSQTIGEKSYSTQWAADWFTAYLFACEKHVITPQSLADALAFDHIGFSQIHALFNLTEQKVWARVFGYTYAGKRYMVKVFRNEITDWYMPNINVQGVEYPWVCCSPTTGEVQEVYTWKDSSNTILEKRSLLDISASAVVTTFVQSKNDLPDEYKVQLQTASDVKNIFGWSSRSYGNIVEFREVA